jgi:ZIP family zinc transporter
MSPLVIICLFIPLVGTTLGSAMVFFLKKEINPKLQKILLGFASGVMIAASIWSLLQPAINSYSKGDFRMWLFPAIGFIAGVGFMLLLDYLVPHMHINKQEEGVSKKPLSRTFKMMLAVTLHNVPEGLAVGVVIASYVVAIRNGTDVNANAMLVLAIGMAIQNFPEGAIVSMPLREEGLSRGKAFLYGFISGVVEPIAAALAILVTVFVEAILPFVLAFAAGVMIYVVVEELIPEANEGSHSNLATIGLAVGFVLMMVLDIALG